MHESPRTRRLKNDRLALEQLRSESSIFDFVVEQTSPTGLAEAYLLRFQGRGVWRPVGSPQVLLREYHEVLLQLNASYPRLMPTLVWKTPFFHPNVASTGVVCLGGYGKYWVPSLSLDELCCMLWDMIRYQNYDVGSPYNREAAYWASSQAAGVFPLDPRSLRNRTATLPRTFLPKSAPPMSSLPEAVLSEPDVQARSGEAERRSDLPPRRVPAPVLAGRSEPVEAEIVFLE